MQAEAPKVFDVSGESEATKKLYGLDDPKTADFGWQCLLARRLAEADVRFIQCTHSYKWDQHSDLFVKHNENAAEVDKPIAGLLKDLKARGLLKDTLVIWSGEFGRTPVSESGNGRDHNPYGYSLFMAGGGVKARLRLRRHRRIRLSRRGKSHAHPRFPRHGAGAAGPGSPEADLPLLRPRFPPDRYRRQRPRRHLRVT